MYQQLENDRLHRKAILSQAFEMAENYFKNQDDVPPGRYIASMNYLDIPAEGLGGNETLRFFGTHYADKMANSAGSRYFGFVTGGSTPASVAGDWLVSVYDQVMSGGYDSIAPHLERQTLHFLKQLFSLDADYQGSFVTGATMANFVGLATARQWVGEQHGIDIGADGVANVPAIPIFSATPHSSILKSLSMMGLGRSALTRIDTLPDREAIDVEKLEHALRNANGPAIVVLNAGTVNTVDFDDLARIGALKTKYNFWIHIDAAFGGFAACSEKYQHLLAGINFADSITIDAHKWLNVPYDAAMQFTRHQALQVKVFQNHGAAYLGDPSVNPDFVHLTPENSRRFRALPSWFSLMAYGRKGYQDIVERNCNAAAHLGRQLEQTQSFKLLAPVGMNVVCFTLADEPTTERVKELLDRVRDDGRVFLTPTNYKGTPAIRAAISNWQTDVVDVEVAFAVLSEQCELMTTVRSE